MVFGNGGGSHPMKARRKPRQGEKGQVLVIAALFMTVLLGMAGLAVDVGIATVQRREAQSAGDAGALAGANDLATGNNSSGAQAQAQADALSQTSTNGFTNGANGAVVTVSTGNGSNCPGKSLPNGSDPNSAVKVVVTKNQPTFLLGVLGKSTTQISSCSVAVGYGKATTPQIALLDPSQPEALDIGITGAVNYPVNLTIDGPLTVNSNQSSEAEQVHNNYHLNAPTNVVGGRIDQLGDGTIGPGYTQLNQQISDPLASTVGIPSTSGPQGTGWKCPPGTSPIPPNTGGCTNGGSPIGCNGGNPNSCIVHHYNEMVNPGVWQDLIVDDDGSIAMNPGTYIITGSLQLIDGPTGPGKITANGVTLYFACPKSSPPYWQTCNPSGGASNANGSGPGGFLNLTGSSSGINPETNTYLLQSTYTITAPTSGPFKGLSIYYDRGNHLPLGDPQTEDHHAALEVECNANTTLAGTIYGAGTRVLMYSTTRGSA
ncbi:MAG: pilus assembly protein TadG-related protein, partial [Dehalococcoidia bacterium]